MSLTPSTMLPLGTPLPLEPMLSALEPVHGPPLQAASLIGRPVLVLFLCPHCPFVKHIEAELCRLERDLGEQPAIVAICSNSTLTHPQDGPAGMADQARRLGWRFPYLADPSQAVARAFQAACTPDLFLFDAAHRLAYRGQLDGSRPGQAIPCDGRDLRAAIDAVLRGDAPSPEQRPSIGCNIKWHPGQEPGRGR
ncbi:MAG: thioredoxin family protein [Synechococcaceae cyanobacterium]|nr:thioredoxin family protein [Synechococcaceae cyanobacterium]